jgi:hypothetical protein
MTKSSRRPPLAPPLKSWNPLLSDLAAIHPVRGELTAYYVLSEVDAFIWEAKCSKRLVYPGDMLRAKMLAYKPASDSEGVGSYVARITTAKESEIVKKFKSEPSLEQRCRPFSCRLMRAVDTKNAASARRNSRREVL